MLLIAGNIKPWNFLNLNFIFGSIIKKTVPSFTRVVIGSINPKFHGYMNLVSRCIHFLLRYKNYRVIASKTESRLQKRLCLLLCIFKQRN